MKCPNEQRRFYEAFYGVAPPDHLYRKVHKVFEKMMVQFKADVSAEFPGIADETLAQGLLYGLVALREAGAERPTVYGAHENLTATALKAACVKVRGLLKTLADKQRAQAYTLVDDEELKQMIAHNQSLKANVMIELEGHIKAAIADGVENDAAKVDGFCRLLANHQHPEGYLYALLGMIIPSELGVYWSAGVVEAMNAHPSLRTMKRKGTPGGFAGMIGGVV